MTRLRALMAGAMCLTTGACGGDDPPAAPPPSPPANQYIVAVDLSGSITAQERSANEELLAAFTRSLSFGDQLMVLGAHAEGRRDGRAPVVVNIPSTTHGGIATLDDSTNRAEAIRIGLPKVRQVLTGSVTTGTDLFATIHSVAELARQDTARKTTLVLMSDMLQCAGGVCMEGGGVPDSAWIHSRKAENTLPDLRGACVVVVGADASTETGQRVRDFWISYFRAAGADLRPEKYSYQVTRPEYLGC